MRTVLTRHRVMTGLTVGLIVVTVGVVLPRGTAAEPPVSALPGSSAGAARDAAGRLEKYVPSAAQLQASAQPRRGGFGSRGMYKGRITPHWSSDNTRFWYRNDLRGGEREFILVDAAGGTRSAAFDSAKLAQALAAAGVEGVKAERLPIDDLTFDAAHNTMDFRIADAAWRCKLDTYELERLAADQARRAEQPGLLPTRTGARTSARTGAETSVTFVNRTSAPVQLFWLDNSGQRQSYGKLGPGDEREQHTFAGHVWEIADEAGKTLAVFQAEEQPSRAEVPVTQRPADARRNLAGRRPRSRRDTSPDGAWTAFVRDHNVFVRSRQDEHEVQLSQDGREGLEYGQLEWSPDSKSLVAFRIEPGQRDEVYLIESSPRGGGRAVLHSRPYPLPGDRFTAYELNLFDVGTAKQVKPDVERIDFGRPELRWNADGHRFTYEKIDRGHQRFRLIEIDSHTGQARNVIDEKSDTFIWTAHREGVHVPLVTWCEGSDEIIYSSERDGWRHLYLVQAATGEIKPITHGEWVVRGLDRVDEKNRQIWFRASGMQADQDPYLIQFYRINFDGTGLTALTAGNGNHSIQYSPDSTYLIDTYSRVDMPPVHELRRVSDGSLVCELEKADITELERNGFQPPEVFVAKGRDGKTDIWGIICRPKDFHPHKRYPVIEQIYAGPQGSFVPKTFRTSAPFASLTNLGFIVVQIDGMGTANRSKAFHDVCWKNLKDAGLPDRILWHQAVAARYPYYDLERLGICGTSAGGQNATAAVLFHGDFYKVAVSACGCHDNRMDKASWNEQWMGYPVGPQYSECSNIDNAYRLQGKLLLIVGEMDTNVPPESTLRLADALIKARKDFDLLVVPGANHGMGGAYGQRRMQDFFVRHLHGVEPPDRNASDPAGAS